MTEETEAQELDLENTLYMDIEFGRVVIAMRPDVAPKHVARIKELTREGFYDGLAFHRVIPGFMAQGGDPLGNGTGGPGKMSRLSSAAFRMCEGQRPWRGQQTPTVLTASSSSVSYAVQLWTMNIRFGAELLQVWSSLIKLLSVNHHAIQRPS